MRLAYINAALGIPLQGPSGASTHIRKICRGLQRHWDVQIVAATVADSRGFFGEAMEATITGRSTFPRYREIREMRTADKVFREVVLQGRPPELLLERHSLFSDAAWRLGAALDIPWMLEVNAPIFEERRAYEHLRWPRLGARWQREVLQACPMIFTVSTWLKQWLTEEMQCRRVRLLPNGTVGLKGNPNRGRALLGIETERPIVGFVGSLKPWQGGHRLAGFAKRIGAVSVCIGLRGSAPLADVHFPVYDDQELADVVSAFSVGVAPYTSQAPPWLCPLKLWDYRAQGIPIVSSNIGDAAIIINGNGTLVEADDDEGFIEGIRYELTRRHERVVRSWSLVANEMVNHVQEWLKTG